MKKISYYVLLCLLGMYFLLYSTPVYAVKNPTATGKPGIKGSGGGGGATGGNAGKAVFHHHVDGCYQDLSYTPTFGDWEYFMWGTNCFDSSGTNSYQYNGHTTSTDDDEWSRAIVRVGWARNGNYPEDQMWNVSGYKGIPTNGNTTLNLAYFCEGWGDVGDNIVNTNWLPDEEQPSEFVILDQNGTKIAQGKFRDYPFTDNFTWNGNNHVGSSEFYQGLNISLPEGTTHIFVHLNFHLRGSVWFTAGIRSLSFSGGNKKICAYEEGDVERSEASFGGTSDASDTDATGTPFKGSQLDQTGNGTFQIHVVNGNLLNGIDNISYLNNVSVRDLAYPDIIKNIEIKESPNRKIITWETPQSNGTEYEFKAQTYMIDYTEPSGTKLIMDTEAN